MRNSRVNLVLLAIVAASMFALAVLTLRPSQAASAPSGPLTAKAGGAVTAGRFVKLSAAGIIEQASAATDAIVGVCELTAEQHKLTMYSTPGMFADVTSGAAVTIGAAVTADANGKAVAVAADSSSTQRAAGIALTAATDADETIIVAIIPHTVEQRRTITGATAIVGATTITGNTAVTGTFAASGNTTVGGTLGVTGAITATGGVAGAVTGNVTGNTTGVHTGTVVFPTSDPGVAGQWWDNAGTLTKSSG